MSGGRAVFEAINGPAPGKFLEDEFRAVCRAKIPMRLIWGKDDTSVP